MIIAIAFAQAIGLTAVGFTMDKKAGVTDRVWAAGTDCNTMHAMR